MHLFLAHPFSMARPGGSRPCTPTCPLSSTSTPANLCTYLHSGQSKEGRGVWVRSQGGDSVHLSHLCINRSFSLPLPHILSATRPSHSGNTGATHTHRQAAQRHDRLDSQTTKPSSSTLGVSKGYMWKALVIGLLGHATAAFIGKL